jgi:hypothetical protein
MRRAVLPVYRSAIVLAKRLESRGPSDLIRLIREVRFFELFVELSGNLTSNARLLRTRHHVEGLSSGRS